MSPEGVPKSIYAQGAVECKQMVSNLMLMREHQDSVSSGDSSGSTRQAERHAGWYSRVVLADYLFSAIQLLHSHPPQIHRRFCRIPSASAR